jgi:hypothetical protein
MNENIVHFSESEDKNPKNRLEQISVTIKKKQLKRDKKEKMLKDIDWQT